MAKNILSVAASVQGENSTSRMLANELLANEKVAGKIANVVERDVSKNDIAFITGEHVGAFYTPADDRSNQQKSLISQSEELVKELKEADTLVIATPMYNFGIPASLKAWVDMICRVGETFRYTENGPEGLLNIDTMYLVVSTGGAPVGSPVDFVVPYMKQVAAFIGVKNVEVIAADATNANRDAASEKARAKIEELAESF
ncbi:FMN-dependent NADH-azoreductase [Oleiphilus sp. HI0009]|nr:MULTISPECIES: NAD(P)H-dependent oxidoreductase [unclassified Oleiphilus]KZX82206.1 FMN-dependent NADH-azoreductase [Oleiphilus sp. HI0009]KZX83700.1 FMN-dependent NADH-azoreductase [Oleiphilus sp. HI0009]KZY69213.1 FMN-dependent NADH-azoreductase [Oleiphilus sp. HI0066]KZY73677.1 FMN-dependent NADH-azoreductase [Oleiphilus sp. HI0067]KZZ62129.1 FMN-dependent NADH-azoreductase [Oleiphilus sp. HI0125]